MLTCGDDKKYRIWNITVDPPVLVRTSTDVGSVIWSCVFSYNDYILLGVDGMPAKSYYPNNNTIYKQYDTVTSGKQLNV